MIVLETKRLILRTWIAADIDPMSAINQDPRVMEYLGELRNVESTTKYIDGLSDHYHARGYTLYPVEIKENNEFIGFIGLRFADYLETCFAPATEIAWRLGFKYWGKGYATEGAKAVLEHAFCTLRLPEVVSLASDCNERSRAVMQKIGMYHNPDDDFDHPTLDKKSPLRRHVLYRISKEEYLKNHIVQKNKQAYDDIAGTWAKEREWHIEKPSIDEAIKHIKKAGKVLDVGCGSGQPIAEYLISQGFDVYGMDISAKLINYAEKIMPTNHLFCGDIRTIELHMTFDAIICWFTLFHIHADEHPLVLQKLYNHLNKNGILCITFADTTHKPDGPDISSVDEHTILSSQFGRSFYHSGNPKAINSQQMLEAGFHIISDYVDQPGNQVILAKKIG